MARLINLGGAVVAIIGLITLPNDLDTWRQRLEDAWDMASSNPLSAFAILFGLALMAYANRESLLRVVRGGRRWQSDKELGDEIHGWLRQFGCQLQDNPGKGVSFNFAATDRNTNRPVNVAKVIGEPGLLLTGKVIFDVSHVSVARDMTEDEMENLRGDLGLEMARSPLPISFNATNVIEEGVTVQHPMLINESMTQSQFMERFGRVSAAMMLVTVLMRRHIRMAQKRMGVAPEQLTPVPKSTPDMEESPPQ